MCIKLSFKVHEHHFNVLSISLVKLQNIPSISGLTIIKLLFSRETQTTKFPNLFDIYHRLVKDVTMH